MVVNPATIEQPTDHTKLERRCPRCHESRYHFAVKTSDNKVSIDCAECGHRWAGRFIRAEWE